MPALAKDSHPTLTASTVSPGTPGKPDPAVLLRAMKALNTPAEECVMIGDTTHDMQLAQAVGVEAIGVVIGVYIPATIWRLVGSKWMGSMQELLDTFV